MALSVDFTDLHAAASRMTGPRAFTPPEAFAAGEASIKAGASPENCHFSIFETKSLADEWHRGRTSALAEALGGEVINIGQNAGAGDSGEQK